MKKLKLSLMGITFVFACVLGVQAGNYAWPGVIWNNVSTNLNYNAIIGTTGTNSSGVFTNNVQSGIVLATSTNMFNLSNQNTFGVSGSQANTNSWPAVGWSLMSSYPNTFAPPANNLEIGISMSLMATNSTSTALVVRFAGSVDGTLWQSNYFAEIYTVAVNSTAGSLQLTNIATGALPFIALQEIDNPGANIATNVTISANQKPGL